VRYQEVEPIAREEADAAFVSGDPRVICDALIRVVYHESEWRVAQEACLRFSTHSNEEVRGLAATCFGHLARIHRVLDLQLVIPVLRKMLDDPIVSGRAQDALDDVKMYLGIEDKNFR
jgi:hypothetical protein